MTTDAKVKKNLSVGGRLRSVPAAPLHHDPEDDGKSEESSSLGARLLAILEAIAESDVPVASANLAIQLGLPRASVHRLCVMLERLSFLERELGGKSFVVGHRQEQLALNSLIHSSYRGARHGALQALASEVGETVNVTVLHGNEVVYIDRVECQWPLRHHLQIGSRVPIHCGASGKLFLSIMPAAARRRLLSAPLHPYTEKSITDAVELEKHLKKIRSSEVSVDDEEFMHGLIGLAVPVYDARKRICATVSLHAPTLRMSATRVLDFVPTMRRTAEAIAKLI